MEIKKLNEEPKVKSYIPDGDEKILQTFVDKRKTEMQDYRTSLGIEKEWREADIEYIPHELEFGTPRKRFETDQDTGLRSRMVPIGDQSQNWRSNASATTLLEKIQTAFSIVIDQNPEAMLTALSRKYEDTTQLAYSLWKRNWAITDGKQVLKLFVFDLLKYGWGIGRSYPCKISYTKQILSEYDSEDPSKNKYEKKELTWFNDVQKQRLSPYKTWIDEQTKPYDVYSMNDWYFEVDFSYDDAKVEFGEYKNFEFVKPDSKVTYEMDGKPATPEGEKENLSKRKDIVTIGFYENRAKDLFVIWVPSDKIILKQCPLPNDDGMLSSWQTPWILRSADSPYGISLWKIIKQDKELYDKYMNMTADQLVLSIMKFGFHTGTSGVLGDGVINIVPGQSKQITNGKFDWMEIPGPGKDAWEGLDYQKKSMDKSSGITQTIEGELTGKTLGEIQLAREAALKRMKVPIDNIAWAIEQDAYLTLSWMKQVYSTPEVREFADEAEILAYEQTNNVEHNEKFAEIDPLTNEPNGPVTATFFPELSLNLEVRDGKLFESEKSKFFQVGKDIKPEQLKWKGIFKVIPRSIIGTSEVILKQTKTEMANMLIPLFVQPPELVKKAAMQILKVNEEDPLDWLPESWLIEKTPEQIRAEQPLFTPENGSASEQGEDLAHMERGGHTMQNRTGNSPQEANKVVPPGQISSASLPMATGGMGKLFKG